MTFNLYLKLVREHCKMTKEEFAQKLEISVVTLTFLEYGEPLWDIKNLKKKVKEIKKEYDKIHSA